MVNGGWVELGFHEERPHQITPISLPAKQVSRENQYWELDLLKDPENNKFSVLSRRERERERTTKRFW